MAVAACVKLLAFAFVALDVAQSEALPTCDQAVTTNFTDLTTGLPGTSKRVPDPYLGLDYYGWNAYQTGTVAQPGPKTIFFGRLAAGSDVRHFISPNKRRSKTNSFNFVSFDWFAAVGFEAPGASVTANATLRLQGNTDAYKRVSATCQYTGGGQVVAPSFGNLPTSQTCTLPNSFDLLKSVTFEVTKINSIGLGRTVVNQINYVRHNDC